MFDRLFRGTAERLIARGNRAEKEGRLEEARELYRLAVRSAPRYPKAHVNLGIALEAAGDLAGAASCHEKALSLDGTDPFASYNLGRLNYLRGALPQAERLLGLALRHREEFPEARFMLACVLAALGRPAPAAAHF